MRRINFSLSGVEHGKKFITSKPNAQDYCITYLDQVCVQLTKYLYMRAMRLVRIISNNAAERKKERKKRNEPRCEKTGLRGFRPGPTQTGLYKLRKELEA